MQVQDIEVQISEGACYDGSITCVAWASDGRPIGSGYRIETPRDVFQGTDEQYAALDQAGLEACVTAAKEDTDRRRRAAHAAIAMYLKKYEAEIAADPSKRMVPSVGFDPAAID